MVDGDSKARKAPKYKLVNVDKLHEDPANARLHPEKNREVVNGSLLKWGQIQTLCVEMGTGRVLGGNCTLGELRALGVEKVMVCEADVHGDEATEVSLVLNHSAELAEWDAERLAQSLSRLAEVKVDLEGLGWTQQDLEGLGNLPEPLNPDFNGESWGNNNMKKLRKKGGGAGEPGAHRILRIGDLACTIPGALYEALVARISASSSTEEGMVLFLSEALGVSCSG